MTTTVLFLLIAHLLTDLSFQGNTIAEEKRLFNKHMLFHIAVSSLTLGAILFFTLPPPKATAALLLWSVSHLLLDIVKKEIDLIKPSWRWPLIGLDQVAHTLVIFLIAQLFY